jgi:predicted lipoprotein with Yx(FWY)xxD motif
VQLFRAIGTTLALGIFFIGANAAGAAAPSRQPAATTLVQAVKAGAFGTVLANGRNQVFYYWDKEKSGQVKCTGTCAVQWPPVIVAKNVMVPATIAGIAGKFSVVMRPDGTHQLAFNHRPLYRYIGDTKPLQVLCDGVDGWHVVRVMAGR